MCTYSSARHCASLSGGTEISLALLMYRPRVLQRELADAKRFAHAHSLQMGRAPPSEVPAAVTLHVVVDVTGDGFHTPIVLTRHHTEVAQAVGVGVVDKV